MNTLPTLTLSMSVRDPNWKPEYDTFSSQAINMDSYYIKQDVECEVVQLNLNAGTMRVRFKQPANNKKGFDIQTRDVSITKFYEHYSITTR